MFTKLPKFSSKKVLEKARQGPCIRCGAAPCEPHHLPSPFGGSRRALDIVIPLCRACHNWMHDNPNNEKEGMDLFYSWALRTWVVELELSWADVWSGVVNAAEQKR